MVAGFALPLSFHPAGHEMIWENEKREFQVARYNTSFWGNSKPLAAKELIGGSITATPNGLGFIHWQKEKPGVGLWFIATGKEERQLADCAFIATPSSVPDGRGIVGLMKQNDQLQLSYFPINMPLADVQNAWMYAESAEETDLLEKNYGLFRTTNQDQLYELYETENYACGDYDRTAPTRPYLVTTDIFWELFASAYEGLFIIAERDKAIPNFWKFIGLADQHYRQSSDSSAWKSVFRALTDLHSGKKENPEVIRILNSAGELWSDDLHDKFDYAELKPRSHYASSEAMQLYFRAFKYFTMVYENNARALEELNQLPSEIQSFALNWIEAYLGFIAPSRSPSVWKKLNATPPSYNENPGSKVTIFPLSWGFDNEVLYSTVYHMNLPPERTIIGPGGERLTPSGLDLAAALGNGLAGILLKPEFEKYPPLKNMVAKLAQNFSKNAKVPKNGANLYDRWITALAIQWADTTASANNNLDKLLWQTKRLQTGLASWATLRHATGLVNERTVAECGEAGFEPIILRAPRGYVEPDPRTFAAIADLFETAIKYIPGEASGAPDLHESYEEAKGSLHEGIHRRLTEIAKDTRTFRDIAEKELAGRELSPEEYEKILYVGTIAEHYFLIFKSLSNPEYALSTPEPMAKIADVAGSRDFSFLNAAVGTPLEWDYVVPFYGRHEIVKGSVYSYYEFNSNELLNDQEWRNRLKTQKPLPWTKPLITEKAVSYPAASGY
jgi:hypothetical protein